jgi:hypothetical protein
MHLAPTRSRWLGSSSDCARTAFYSAASSVHRPQVVRRQPRGGNKKAKKLQLLHTQVLPLLMWNARRRPSLLRRWGDQQPVLPAAAGQNARL